MTDKLLLKALLLSVLLIETFDELEEQDIYKHLVKSKGNQFKLELEKLCKKVFDNCEESLLATDYVSQISQSIDSLIEPSVEIS